VTHAQERFYESGRWIGWEHLWHDLRYGLRMLRNSPGFTAIAVLTIALGIGSTTGIFSVVDAALLHPLPYPQPDQLVSIQDDLPGVGARDVGMSEPEWQDLQVSGIFEYVSRHGSMKIISQAHLNRRAFACLSWRRIISRCWASNRSRAASLMSRITRQGSYRKFSSATVCGNGPSEAIRIFWTKVCGSTRTCIESSASCQPVFYAPGPTTEERNVDVWVATSFYGAPLADHPSRNRRNLPEAIARLKPGLTISAAQSRVEALVAALQKQFPGNYPLPSAWTVRLVPLKENAVGNVRQSLILLLGAIGLVLLIGCVNVANLLLARASARGREMALRQALGAARKRLMSQLLTESLLLSLIGGITGLAILFSTKALLLRVVPDSLPRLHEVSINWAILLFALVVSLLAGIAFGLAPALHAGRFDLTPALKQAARGSTGSGKQSRTRRMLVIIEFALSLVLMIAAGLLLRSFWAC
jgi:hypothetical protein